jgi:hypothetical protein
MGRSLGSWFKQRYGKLEWIYFAAGDNVARDPPVRFVWELVRNKGENGALPRAFRFALQKGDWGRVAACGYDC